MSGELGYESVRVLYVQTVEGFQKSADVWDGVKAAAVILLSEPPADHSTHGHSDNRVPIAPGRPGLRDGSRSVHRSPFRPQRHDLLLLPSVLSRTIQREPGGVPGTAHA